jgi:hypothetical protein
LFTSWETASQVISLSVYAFVWMRGGHPERFGAAVLLLNHLAQSITYLWVIDGFYWAIAIHDSVLLLIFGWYCLRSTRWWPFVATAGFVLISFVRVLDIVNPDMSQRDMMSAQIGFWFMIDMSLLGGVVERYLAGEPAAGRSAWARVERRNSSAAPGI